MPGRVRSRGWFVLRAVECRLSGPVSVGAV